MLQVCPTAVVEAPAERVWQLLATPKELAAWTGMTIIEAPDHELRAGDRLVLGGVGIGRALKAIFEVQQAVRPSCLVVQVRLPFGLTNNEVTQITSAGDGACRVTFN